MPEQQKKKGLSNGVKALLGVVGFFAVCALVSFVVNRGDIALGKELSVGEPVVASVDGEEKFIVTANSARQLSATEAVRMQVQEKGETLIAVDVQLQLLDPSYLWGADHMRVRDGSGKYGEVIAVRDGSTGNKTVICRIKNPSDTVSFFVYAGNWTTSSSLQATGRYKLDVAPAPADPVELSRQGLDRGELVFLDLTVQLGDDVTYNKHMVQDSFVLARLGDMELHADYGDFEEPMEMELYLRASGLSGVVPGGEEQLVEEPARHEIAGQEWYAAVYESEGYAGVSYFTFRDALLVNVRFAVQGGQEQLDRERVADIMETARFADAE